MTSFSTPLEARLGHYAAELRTLSVTYPLCGSALTNTMDNPSEMCLLKNISWRGLQAYHTK